MDMYCRFVCCVLLFFTSVNCCMLMVVVVIFVAIKDASLKIEELKRHEDAWLDKGLMPEESDSVLVFL